MGRVVKLIGDEVMFVAPDPATACEIALRVAELFEESEHDVEPSGGIAYGALLVRGGDYYGPVVNLASRLADIAIPGEVLVTTPVAEDVDDEGLVFERAGRRMVKGFDDPIDVVSVTRRSPSA